MYKQMLHMQSCNLNVLFMFLVSFLFNWVGLLVSLCITNTVAGRFGALAGFGLSLVKWVAIIKVSY